MISVTEGDLLVNSTTWEFILIGPEYHGENSGKRSVTMFWQSGDVTYEWEYKVTLHYLLKVGRIVRV